MVEAATGAGDKQLIGYVVGTGEKGAVAQWRAALKAKLPGYMIPGQLVVLESIPLTANGKVDRQGLAAARRGVGAAEPVAAARTPVEEVLAAIFSEVLGREPVSVIADFFELGGHSLLATQVISRVNSAFEVELPIRSLFERASVRGLSEEIEAQRRAGVRSAVAPIRASERGEFLPLSYAQQRLWFLEQLTPGNVAYNIPAAVRLRGALQVAALQRSLAAVVQRHEVLRTSFPARGGAPRQQISSAVETKLALMDLSSLGQVEREELVVQLAGEEARRAFDLSVGPLLRAQLLRLGASEHVLLLTMHHIISDGWSMGILVREVATLYESYSSGQQAALAPLAVQYADFALWQREWLQGEVLERQLRYWREQLRELPALELATDYGRPAVASYLGASVGVELGAELTLGLRELSRREGVTLFMTLLGAFQVLLGRYSGQREVVVG